MTLPRTRSSSDSSLFLIVSRTWSNVSDTVLGVHSRRGRVGSGSVRPGQGSRRLHLSLWVSGPILRDVCGCFHFFSVFYLEEGG